MPQLTIDPNKGAGKFLIGQYDPNRSAEHAVLAAGQGDLPDGTVMAMMTGGANVGTLQKFVGGGADGAGTAWGLLVGDKKNSASTQRVVVVVRHQVVNNNLITFAGAANDAQKAAARAALTVNGVIFR